jgi:hypothetical protein
MMLHEAYSNYDGDNITIFEPDVCYPLPAIDNKNLGLTALEIESYQAMVDNRTYPDSCMAVHHWAGTWHKNWFQKLKEWLRS